MTDKSRVLVVEDDEDLCDTIAEAFKAEDYIVEKVRTVRDAKQKIETEDWDLAIIDVLLPDGSGYAIVRGLVSKADTRIIILTGRDTVADRVEGYTHGADIYLSKPVSEAELLAAAGAALRRRDSPGHPATEWNLDPASGYLRAPNGEKTMLSTRETLFMQRVMQTPGQPVTRQELQKLLSPNATDQGGRGLDMFVARLRRHIETDLKTDAPVLTVQRVGFVFKDI